MYDKCLNDHALVGGISKSECRDTLLDFRACLYEAATAPFRVRRKDGTEDGYGAGAAGMGKVGGYDVAAAAPAPAAGMGKVGGG